MTGQQQQRYHALREKVVTAIQEYSEAVVKESNNPTDPKLKFMRETKGVNYKNAWSEFNTYVPGISI
jgi:hypothetical protein